MSHRTWWLICLFALVIGAAIEFDQSRQLPAATSAASPAPARPAIAADEASLPRS